MASEFEELTWQSLYEYIERRIVGVLNGLQLIENDKSVSSYTQTKASLEHDLDLLRWYLPLVKKMQSKEIMQVVCPIMSIGLIRLRYRPQHNSQVSLPDFAWIAAIADDRYSLVRVKVSKPEGLEKLWSFEGDLVQIVEKIENLVKEICTEDNH